MSYVHMHLFVLETLTIEQFAPSISPESTLYLVPF